MRNSSKTGIQKKLGAYNFPAILSNNGYNVWTGEIEMGELTKMDMIFDTGSDWLMVKGASCTNCYG